MELNDDPDIDIVLNEIPDYTFMVEPRTSQDDSSSLITGKFKFSLHKFFSDFSCESDLFTLSKLFLHT